MSVVPGPGGDPHDTGFVPVSTTVIGAIVVFLSAVLGGTAIVAIRLAGGPISGTAIWTTAAFLGFGLALILWDQLTDYFDSTTPGEGFPDDEDENAALGVDIDGTVTSTDQGDADS